MEYLLPLFGERMFEVNEHGLTCLHYAVFGSSLPVMRYLVDQWGFDLSLSAAVSCRVIHDRVMHSLRRFVFDVQYVYSRFRQCYAHALQYILHTHDHTYTHTRRTCITHIHTYHTNLPHTITVNSFLQLLYTHTCNRRAHQLALSSFTFS